jgi:hypothetical protein
MRAGVASICVASLCACVAPASDDDELGETDETSTTDTGETSTTDTDETSTTETGEDSETSDDETGEPPVPEDLPTSTGACPSFANGNAIFSPAEIAERSVRLWVSDNPQPGGMLVIYWHAYGSDPAEAEYTLSMPVIDAILASGGMVAAPYPADDVGEFPWFVVNNSPRDDDMLVGDEIVACAIEQGIDPRRIHATGMSAGGLQTVAYSMARSRYVASATSFSGGEYSELPFEDPDNHFAAMIVHGGDSDLFGGVVNFELLSVNWFNQLTGNGNFAFMCDHGGGHTVPPGYGPSVANFFFAHPFGTEPSPYAAGLPADLPDDCSL